MGHGREELGLIAVARLSSMVSEVLVLFGSYVS